MKRRFMLWCWCVYSCIGLANASASAELKTENASWVDRSMFLPRDFYSGDNLKSSSLHGQSEILDYVLELRPDVEGYIQDLITEIEEFYVSHPRAAAPNGGGMLIEALLARGIEFNFANEDNVARGQPYGIFIDENVHFEISLERDNIRVDNVDGLKVYAKIPFLPDAVKPYALYLDTQNQQLTIRARVLWGLWDFVTDIDLKNPSMRQRSLKNASVH